MAWQRQEEQGIRYYRSSLLAGLPWLVHAFSTRGTGKAPEGEENAGTDQAEERRRFFALFRLSPAQVRMVKQVHGTAVHVVAKAAGGEQTPEADALVTNLPGVGLATVHADCVPVLIVDPVRRAIAAVHAGWKGTLAQIVPKTLAQMEREYGTVPEDCWAAIGPAVGACCYRVSAERYKLFQESGLAAGLIEQDGIYALDLAAINRHYLRALGVPDERIDPANLCTACHPEVFYSYRREQTTGRMLSLIAIKENGKE